MSSSYLGTSYYFQLKQALIDSALSQPVGLPTSSLRAVLDKALVEICQKKSDSHIYHPDYTWLEKHIFYLSQLTGWDLLALHRANFGNEYSQINISEDEFFFDTNNIQYLAFAYADGALAENLAAEIRDDEHGFFVVAPTGEKDSRSLLVQQHSFQEMCNVYGYLHHPLRQWLFNQARNVKDVAWPTFVEKSQAQYVQPVLEKWREFVHSQRLNAIHQASVDKPIYLGQHHFTNGQQVFFQHLGDDYEPVLLENCDINTFKEIEDQESNGWYAADANHLWNCGEPLLCENPAEFKPLPEHMGYFTDGRYVYHDNCVLDDVDARKVRGIPGERWWRGFLHEDTFYPNYGNIYEVDGATFHAVANQYYVDKNGVYEFGDGELILREGFDPATFEVMDLDFGELYIKDKASLAYARKSGLKPKFIKGVDVDKFTAVIGLPFYSDEKRIWLDGKECKDLDAVSIRTLPLSSLVPKTQLEDVSKSRQSYFISHNQVFYMHSNQYQLLQGADSESLELLNVSMARDKNHVWYYGEVVKGAVPTGFTWLNFSESHWMDGVNQYLGGNPFNQNAKFFPGIDRDLSLIGSEYYLNDKKIEGWSSQSHFESKWNCIEDTQYFYTCFTHSYGAILVWPKFYSDNALAYYQIDKTSDTWRLTSKIPPLEALASMPNGTLLTREEFDTLFNSINRLSGYEVIETEYKDPDVIVTRWRDSFSLNIKGDLNYGAMWYGDTECNESVSPIRTPANCEQIRDVLNRILKYESPISFATLKELVNRIPAALNVEAFPLKTIANGVNVEANMDVQSGVDSVRGVWIDAKIDGQVLRMMVTEENEFLSGMCYTGALSLFRQVDYEGFLAEGWTAERRALFRQLIAEFLDATKAVRNVRSKKTTEGKWANPCISDVIDLIAPQLNKTQRKQMVNVIFNACNAEVPDHLSSIGGDYATAEGVAWETLLEELESESLLVTFDKDDVYRTVDLCNQLATAAGFKDMYEPSEDATGDSFYSIAQDFDRWLEPKNYCLIWPQNSLSTSGDDLYPAAIAPISHLGAINDQLAKLGGYRRFLYTTKY